jgi:hypothetical protein
MYGHICIKVTIWIQEARPRATSQQQREQVAAQQDAERSAKAAAEAEELGRMFRGE